MHRKRVGPQLRRRSRIRQVRRDRGRAITDLRRDRTHGVHGTAELTEGMDITPSIRADKLARLKNGLHDLEAKRRDRKRLDLGSLDEPVVALRTRAGELKLVPEPAGTRGYDDLRRHASREPLGQGVRPQVASPGDLARMLGALEQPEQLPSLLRLRRLIELERERNRGLTRER